MTEQLADRGPAHPNGLRVELIERAGSRAQTFADPLDAGQCDEIRVATSQSQDRKASWLGS
jgi:hypothetical protein